MRNNYFFAPISINHHLLWEMENLSNSIHRGIQYGSDKGCYTYYPILIIGAGESGIAMGCRLKEKLRFDQFRIFDRQAGIGGTWWINKYPGVACDLYARSSIQMKHDAFTYQDNLTDQLYSIPSLFRPTPTGLPLSQRDKSL